MAPLATMMTCVLVWCTLPRTEDKLTWLGPRVELEETFGKNHAGKHCFAYLLNDSLKELSCTDFDGEPKTLDRDQRHFVSGSLKNYLDHVGEIYSPPRVTQEGQRQGLRGKIALDLTTGWDFCRADHRQQPRDLIKKHKPAVILLSPPCRPFSVLRHLSNFKRDYETVKREQDEGQEHMRFCIELAFEQIKEGRGFILEQPKNATSWKLEVVEKLLSHPDVYTIHLDMCRFGLRAQRGPFSGSLVKKPTLLATNIAEMAEHVTKVCQKTHQHGPLLGGAAEKAAEYTPSFVKALLEGIKSALGIKSPEKVQSTDAFKKGKSLGSMAYMFAKDQVELDEDMQKLVFANQETDEMVDEEEQSAEQEVRRRLRNIGDQPRVSSALEKVEDFQRTDEGEFSLAPALRREVHRVHRNLGHPALEIFVRALKNAGVRDDVISWAKNHFRCPTCEARPRPTPARPGHLMRALEFNTVVGIDLCFPEVHGVTLIVLNMLCWGTNFQQAGLCRNKSGEEILEVFMRQWVQHYGPPVLLIMDRGKEFDNYKFQEMIGGMGVGLHYTDPQSPWQNTRTEKAGGILKEKLLATAAASTAALEEIPTVLSEVVSARNRYMDRFGFSPMQRVFGKSLRLPSSLLSTDAMDRELTEAAAGDPVRRTWEIRESATREWVRRQDQNAVKRSLKAQTRTSDLKNIPPGSWVYVFRDTPSYKGWTGPGVMIADDQSHRSCWVSMRGRLWKVSREQIRMATPEEELGAELVIELSKEMLDKLHKPGQIAYQDVTNETLPQDADLTDDELVRVLRITEERAHEQPPQVLEPERAPQDERDSVVSTRQPSEIPQEMETDDGMSTEPPASTVQSRRVSVQSDQAPEVPRAMETIEEEEGQVPPTSPPPKRIRVDEGTDGTMHFGPATTRSSQRTMPYEGAPAESSTVRGSYPFDREVPSLPRPPGNSLYLEVTVPDKDEDLRRLGTRAPFVGVTWRFDREQGRKVPQPRVHSEGTFSRSQAEASFNLEDKCMYVSKSKASFGQVEFSKLPEEEKVKFRASRKKEIDSLIANGAVRILSVAESLEFMKHHPEQIIDSKFVDRFKPKEVTLQSLENYKRRAIQEGHLEAIQLEEDQTNPKSRLCAVGWQDPQIHEVERSSPTPLSTSLYCCLQLAASRRWKTRVKDVKTAFLQALPTTRNRRLACRQPRDESLPGLDPRQLLLLLTEIYGLVSGPSWWRRTLLKISTEKLGYRVNPYDRCVLISTEKLGYRVNPYDRCVLVLPSEDPRQGAPTDGFMVIEVDDIAESGNSRHVAKMKELESMLKFGKIEELQTKEGSNYAGRRLRQLADFGFEASMDEFIYTRLQPISMSRKVLKKDAKEVKLDEKEKTQLRGLIASLNWVAREGRPDCSAAASILASSFPEPTVAHIISANEVVQHLKTFPVKLRIHAIPEGKLRNILIADSAFDTSGKEKSQHGWLLGYTDETMNQGMQAPVSLMQWRSKRLRRKASSSMLCEAISMSAATGALERQVAFMESIKTSYYSPRQRQRTEDESLEAAGKATVIASESTAFVDPLSIVVMDAKALFDALHSEQPQGDDERSALEVAIIKESLVVTQGRPRWVPHNLNPCDGLTKVEGAHVEPLLKLLKSNSYCIEEEDEVLDRGKQSANRMKVSVSSRNFNLLGAVKTSLQSWIPRTHWCDCTWDLIRRRLGHELKTCLRPLACAVLWFDRLWLDPFSSCCATVRFVWQWFVCPEICR